jgi:hypothetical protein
LLALVGLVLGAVLVSRDLPVVAAQSIDPSFVQPVQQGSLPEQAVSPPDCDSSPFGRVQTLGGEQEIFVGYRGGPGSASANWLHHARLDLDQNGHLEHRATWLGGQDDIALRNARWQAGTTADLNGDGKVEYVQTGTDTDGAYRTIAHRNDLEPDYWRRLSTNKRYLDVASGNLTRNSAGHDRIVLVAQTAVGSLSVMILTGDLSGGIGTPDQNFFGLWRSNVPGRINATDIRVATADLDGDGFDDEIVVVFREAGTNWLQIVVLEYAPGHSEGSGSNIQQQIREISTTRIEAFSNVTSLAIATGDLDGNFRDEVVIAWDSERPDRDGISEKISLNTFAFQDSQLRRKGQWEDPISTRGLGLAVADTDRDGLAEVVLVHGAFEPSGLMVRTLNAEFSEVFVHNKWFSSEEYRTAVQSLVVAAGDLDRDGMADIVAVFRDDAGWLQVVHLTDQEMPST